MASYKIVKFHGSCGNVQLGFVDPDGKVKDLPNVGRVWKWSEYNKGWCPVASVAKSNIAGLLRYDAGKSKVAKSLTLVDGEIYLPLDVTGRALFLKALPEVV